MQIICTVHKTSSDRIKLTKTTFTHTLTGNLLKIKSHSIFEVQAIPRNRLPLPSTHNCSKFRLELYSYKRPTTDS